MTKTVYLIRHGESTRNTDRNRLSGIVDVPMTDAGKEPCRGLSQFFRDHPVDVVYSSRLARATETAAIIFGGQQVVELRDELIEVDYGDMDGQSISDLPEDDLIAVAWKASPGGVSFPGGQNIRVYAEHVMQGMLRLVRDTPKERMACVTHKTMGRLFVAMVIGLDIDNFRAIPMDNCSVTEFAWNREDGFALRCLNVTARYIAH